MSIPSSTSGLLHPSQEPVGRGRDGLSGSGLVGGKKVIVHPFSGSGFLHNPLPDYFFFPQLIPLKKVINIQNILAQITSYTLTASAPTKLMPVCIH